MSSPAASSPETPARPVPDGARFAIIVLTAMNLLNYIDRYVPSAVKTLFQKDLGLTDAQTSWPLTAFVIVYMLASPAFGGLADRWSRKVLIAAGVALWSLATAAAALATGFWSFLFARALVGVGEAAYAVISPALIADYFPPERRNRMLTIFYVAIPVGSALGFGIGGVVGQHWGWRTAFLVCGLPGLLVAALALMMKEPRRGYWESETPVAPPGWSVALKALAANREFVWTVAGYTLVTFASGALADWFAAFLNRYRGYEVGTAGLLMGGAAAGGGLVGTVVGGLLGDKLKGRTRNPYLALSGSSILVAAVFTILAIVITAPVVSVACMFLGQVFMWMYNGPVNTVLVNSVSPQMRARAFSISILSIHLFGDAISPTIVGLASDAVGSLQLALWFAPAALALGAAVWLHAWWHLPERKLA